MEVLPSCCWSKYFISLCFMEQSEYVINMKNSVRVCERASMGVHISKTQSNVVKG